MHWFCSNDPNVKEKGFSAFYFYVKIALRIRNPLPKTIQTTLNLFFVEGKRIAVAEKRFSIQSPKLCINMCNDKIIA
jgi:hypothetical protein